MLFRSHLDGTLSDYNIGGAEGGLMMMLHHHGPQSLVELSRNLTKAHPSVLRHIDTLEKAGYIKRSPHPDDRRIKIVSLTKSGEEIVPKILLKLNAVHDLAVKNLSQAEIEKLIYLMSQVFLNLCEDVELKEKFSEHFERFIMKVKNSHTNDIKSESK